MQGRLPWLPLVSYRFGQSPTRGPTTLRAYWQGLGGRIAISYQSRLIATCTVAQVRQARNTIMEHRAQAIVAGLVKVRRFDSKTGPAGRCRLRLAPPPDRVSFASGRTRTARKAGRKHHVRREFRA